MARLCYRLGAHAQYFLMQQFFELLGFLRPADRRRLWFILFGILVAAIIDAVGVASVVPFLALIANSGSPMMMNALSKLRTFVGVTDHRGFVILIGILSLGIIVLSSVLNACVAWAQVHFTNRAGFTISRRLLDAYLAQGQLALLSRNSTEMGKNILSEVDRLVSSAFTPAITLVSRTAATVCIIGFLMFVEPVLTPLLALLFGGVYVGIYALMLRRLRRIGEAAMHGNEVRFKVVNEAFAALRELRLYGRVHTFIRRFDEPALAFARANASGLIIGQAPKFILEPMAFAGVVLTVIYTMRSGGELSAVLPLIGVFAFAGYRLIPAFQNIFMAFSTVRFYLPAAKVIVQDINGSTPVDDTDAPAFAGPRLSCEISLQNVSFGFRDSVSVLKHIDLEIKAHSTVGLIGRTGSGKTTLLSLILGLLVPTSGGITVDGRPLAGSTRIAWQRGIGYVPQDVFLTDDTVAANIALGVPSEAVDLAAVERAAQLANLHEFILTLPAGYKTVVGERGSQLSGGQRQRIGIARALYHDPQVIVFDEATSSLDTETEANFLQAVDGLSGKRTIIIVAHRGSTLRRADVVHMLENGRIIASGPVDKFTSMLGADELRSAGTTVTH